MITEDYVSFETAKLLKEKGFLGEGCRTVYFDKTLVDCTIFGPYLGAELIPGPTLQMAMKWIREVCNILLVVDYEWECDTTPYFFKIYRLDKNGKPKRVAVKGISCDKDDNLTEHIVGYRDWERSYGDYSTYKQACEAAIRYCLENLI